MVSYFMHLTGRNGRQLCRPGKGSLAAVAFHFHSVCIGATGSLRQFLALAMLFQVFMTQRPWAREGIGTAQSSIATNRSPSPIVIDSKATNQPVDLGSRQPLDDKIKIGVGDKLVFRILEDQDEARAMAVNDSGDIDVPYIGRVVAKDRTCMELAAFIKGKLEEEFYHQATVVLSLEQFNRTRGKIYLSGYVRVPGAMDIPSDEVFTLSKAILRAGGFNEFAEKKKVKLMRKSDTNAASAGIVVDVGAIIEEGNSEKDLVLQPGDLIFVPNRLFKF